MEDYGFEDDSFVSYLPAGCSIVYVGGERLWFRDGCYFRPCGHGYKKIHCRVTDRRCSGPHRILRREHCVVHGGRARHTRHEICRR